MAIRVVCPTCGKNLTAPDAAAGKQASCPACKTKIVVPATAAQPKAAAAQPSTSPPRSTPRPTAPQTAPRNAPPPPSKPVQPVARASGPKQGAVPSPAASGATVQLKPAPPPPPQSGGNSGAASVAKSRAPIAADDDFVNPNDVEVIDEYGVSPDRARPIARTETSRPAVEISHNASNVPAAQKSRVDRRRPTAPTPAAPAGARRFLYFAVLLAIVPLAVSIAGGEGDLGERLGQTFATYPETSEIEVEPGMDADDLLQRVADTTPEHRIIGAHLSTDSWMHWIYALLSAGAFLAIAIFLFERGTANPQQLLGVGATTATLGILSLLLIHFAASFTSGILISRNVIVLIIFYVLKFIAFSYHCASDPDNGFLLSFFGYTLGVGLCEELVKAAPVLLRMRSPRGIDWRGACVWGLASGVGFGVAEGIMYSSDSYNGVHAWDAYLVRFVSCVALHAVWSAAVGIMVWHQRNKLAGDLDWKELTLVVLISLSAPMILHGLYDTMLKRDMPALALVTAIVSFAWLAGLIEWTRNQEANEAPPPKKALRSIRTHQSPMLPSE